MKMNEVKKVKEAKEEKPKVVHCSQCGKGFNAAGLKAPYHTGFSHCKDHKKLGAKMVAEKAKIKEAHMVTMHVEDDHEVNMAQGDLYELAKKAIALHKMLDNVDQLEGWVQAKITLAADYIGTVHDYLDHGIAMQSMHQEESMHEAAIIPTGTTTSMRKLPTNTQQMVRKVSTGINKAQNTVMTDKDGNVSVVSKKDVPNQAKMGMMTVDETSFADAGDIAGGVLGGVAGAALGKTPSAAVAGSALGAAAGTAAGKWIDNKLDLGEDDESAENENIIYQLRKVINLRGQYEVKFADGTKSMVPVRVAHAVLQKFSEIRMPDQKLAFVRSAGKSLDDLKAVTEGSYTFTTDTYEKPKSKVPPTAIRVKGKDNEFQDLDTGKIFKTKKFRKPVEEEAAEIAKRMFGEDWGSSDTSAAIDSMKDYIRSAHGGKYNPDSIEDAARVTAGDYYDQMGYDNEEQAADALVGHFVRRWMSGSLRAD